MPGPLPELAAYLEGLPEPHILFDAQYRIAAANAAYRSQFGDGTPVVGRRCFEVSHRFDVPCDQAGESCPLARSRASGQRERVLHLHHTPRGEAYVDIELVPLHSSEGAPAWFIEKMEPLRGAQAHAHGAGGPAGEALIGRSPAFRAMLELVARVGPSRAAVLLQGETGTGKELVAQALHAASARAGRPLVVVDCASLPETLFESELFGHEKGAFTGAQAAKAGLVEAADGGTLFLDEVGDIPLALQVKLLRLLESGTYRRVGSTELRHADVRLVSATHRDIAARVAEGRFREDLYFRLATFPITLPPLREREGDVPLLATALLERLAPGAGLTFAPAALLRLGRQAYPGNVRELRNVVERAVLLRDATQISAAVVEQALAVGRRAPGAASAQTNTMRAQPAEEAFTGHGRSFARPLRASREAAEQAALEAALAAHEGSREALARELGISLRTLYRRLKAIAPASGR